MSIENLANAYHQAVHAAATLAVPAEEEAQLTTPVSNLFTGLARLSNLGSLQLVRETRLDGTRPDFAALLTRGGKLQQKGYVELKAPSVSVDATTWGGRNARQWEKMKIEADVLIVCNGREAQLYRGGQPIGTAATLPYETPDHWNGTALTALLDRFFELRPLPVTSIDELTRRLAVRTADLRDRILWLLDEQGEAAEAAKGGLASWQRYIYPHASARDFADGVSQVVAYGMVLAALSPGSANADDDGHLSVSEARAAIRDISPVLAAAFAPLIDKPALYLAIRVEIGALEGLVSAIDVRRVATPDRRGDPWLRFYEDFLAVYDPEERRQAGVYYTPIDAVAAITAMVDHLLVQRFGKRLGFGDEGVVTLDPATGTGTFPLAAIDRAVRRARKARGAAGEQQVAANLCRTLYAFELLPGPYAVAHLRLSQRLSHLLKAPARAQVVLTDTLESPETPSRTLESWGDAQVLAEEQDRANRIKLEQRVTVVIGNPPYRRVASGVEGRGSGGWVIGGSVPGRKNDRSLFDDVLDIAKANTIFSHHASLYNLYVYFWRWAIWKAFEAHGQGPGVVAFITASSWLYGPGFVGLRQLARETADEIWVLDLGGDNKGANPEDNIFAIETPVAIVLLVRDGAGDVAPAPVHYRRLRGTSEAKLVALRAIADANDPFAGSWQDAPMGWTEAMLPLAGDAGWEDMPLLTDLFPWQQPGCKFGRTWPIAPSRDLLERRWAHFVRSPAKDRSALFVTATSGRSVETKVAGLKRLSEEMASDPSRPIVRYGYRSFDTQWAFDDPRMAKTDSPSLWQAASAKQIYLTSIFTSRIGAGPALTISVAVPDLHFFNGRGGKDIIPLWRDAAATIPNLTAGLAAMLGRMLGIAPPSVADIAAYVYALLGSPAYQERFTVALERAGLRVPITANADLW